MITNNLVGIVDELVNEFVKKTNALHCEIKSNRTYVCWNVGTQTLRFEFVYYKKGGVLVAPSTLFIRLYPRKNSIFYFHMYEIENFFELNDFRTVYFSYIESEQSMRICFKALSDILITAMPKLYEFTLNNQLFETIVADKKGEMKSLLSIKDNDVPKNTENNDTIEDRYWKRIIKLYETNVLLVRYTASQSYTAFLTGDINKAKKYYAKHIDRCTNYEKKLYDFLCKQCMEYSPLPENFNGPVLAKKYATSSKEGKLIFINMLVLAIPFCALFILMTFTQNLILGIGSEGIIGMPPYLSFMYGILPALFGGVALRKKLYKLLYKSEYEQILAMDSLINSKAINKFSSIVFYIVTTICLVMSVWMTSLNIRVKSDKMIIVPGENFMSFDSETYMFDDVSNIYYVNGRYNYLGDYIRRGSYILEFKNGEFYDFDGMASNGQVEKLILPKIQQYNGNVSVFKSIEDINKIEPS